MISAYAKKNIGKIAHRKMVQRGITKTDRKRGKLLGLARH